MNHKTPLILAVGMAMAVAGLYAWDQNATTTIGAVTWLPSVSEDVPESQPEPKPRFRIEDHLTVLEFQLDDETPCVMVFAPSSGPIRLAGPSIPGKAGISCDWHFRLFRKEGS